MFLIFLDESGYTPDWRQGVEEQPFYVLSAVCLPSESLQTNYEALRNAVEALGLPGQEQPLGRGFEIKAKKIAKATGWWKEHEAQRNAVRDAMLEFPRKAGGTAFVAVIDKAAHERKYVEPVSPYLLTTQFLFERLQWFLQEKEEFGYCVFDQNARLEQDRQGHAAALLREGSPITYFSSYYDQVVSYTFDLNRILETAFALSHCSIGLQVADYFATMTYMYFRDGRPSPCRWWGLLESSLNRKDGIVKGYGLKSFP